jgi:hypothetical protein
LGEALWRARGLEGKGRWEIARANEEVLMAWYTYIAWLFAGAFLANAIPHTVQGICGNRFQTPFASPPGVGESSGLVNVIWGFVNLAIGGGLLHIFFPSELPPHWTLCAAALIGALAMALWLANHFGKVRSAAPHP